MVIVRGWSSPRHPDLLGAAPAAARTSSPDPDGVALAPARGRGPARRRSWWSAPRRSWRSCRSPRRAPPAKLKPVTSNGQASVTVRQCSPTWAKIDGIEVARCGSLASIGWPVAVRDPDTTQELEPGLAVGLGARRAARRARPVDPVAPSASTSVGAAELAGARPTGSGRAELRRAVGSNACPTHRAAADDRLEVRPADSPGTGRPLGPRPSCAVIERPLGLLVQVGAEIPGHHLQPGHRVDRRPRLAACSPDPAAPSRLYSSDRSPAERLAGRR